MNNATTQLLDSLRHASQTELRAALRVMADLLDAERAGHAYARIQLAGQQSRIHDLKEELRRCVDLLDSDATLPELTGTGRFNADTRHAHGLLGDFVGQDD